MEIQLTDDETTKLTELINTTKVAAKPVEYPPVPLLFVDQKVRDTQGIEYDYFIYNAEDGNDYVFFHHLNEYYKINDTSIGDFYREVLERELEKPLNKRGFLYVVINCPVGVYFLPLDIP